MAMEYYVFRDSRKRQHEVAVPPEKVDEFLERSLEEGYTPIRAEKIHYGIGENDYRIIPHDKMQSFVDFWSNQPAGSERTLVTFDDDDTVDIKDRIKGSTWKHGTYSRSKGFGIDDDREDAIAPDFMTSRALIREKDYERYKKYRDAKKEYEQSKVERKHQTVKSVASLLGTLSADPAEAGRRIKEEAKQTLGYTHFGVKPENREPTFTEKAVKKLVDWEYSSILGQAGTSLQKVKGMIDSARMVKDLSTQGLPEVEQDPDTGEWKYRAEWRQTEKWGNPVEAMETIAQWALGTSPVKPSPEAQARNQEDMLATSMTLMRMGDKVMEQTGLPRLLTSALRIGREFLMKPATDEEARIREERSAEVAQSLDTDMMRIASKNLGDTERMYRDVAPNKFLHDVAHGVTQMAQLVTMSRLTGKPNVALLDASLSEGSQLYSDMREKGDSASESFLRTLPFMGFIYASEATIGSGNLLKGAPLQAKVVVANIGKEFFQEWTENPAEMVARYAFRNEKDIPNAYLIEKLDKYFPDAKPSWALKMQAQALDAMKVNKEFATKTLAGAVVGAGTGASAFIQTKAQMNNSLPEEVVNSFTDEQIGEGMEKGTLASMIEDKLVPYIRGKLPKTANENISDEELRSAIKEGNVSELIEAKAQQAYDLAVRESRVNAGLMQEAMQTVLGSPFGTPTGEAKFPVMDTLEEQRKNLKASLHPRVYNRLTDEELRSAMDSNTIEDLIQAKIAEVYDIEKRIPPVPKEDLATPEGEAQRQETKERAKATGTPEADTTGVADDLAQIVVDVAEDTSTFSKKKTDSNMAKVRKLEVGDTIETKTGVVIEVTKKGKDGITVKASRDGQTLDEIEATPAGLANVIGKGGKVAKSTVVTPASKASKWVAKGEVSADRVAGLYKQALNADNLKAGKEMDFFQYVRDRRNEGASFEEIANELKAEVQKDGKETKRADSVKPAESAGDKRTPSDTPQGDEAKGRDETVLFPASAEEVAKADNAKLGVWLRSVGITPVRSKVGRRDQAMDYIQKTQPTQDVRTETEVSRDLAQMKTAELEQEMAKIKSPKIEKAEDTARLKAPQLRKAIYDKSGVVMSPDTDVATLRNVANDLYGVAPKRKSAKRAEAEVKAEEAQKKKESKPVDKTERSQALWQEAKEGVILKISTDKNYTPEQRDKIAKDLERVTVVATPDSLAGYEALLGLHGIEVVFIDKGTFVNGLAMENPDGSRVIFVNVGKGSLTQQQAILHEMAELDVVRKWELADQIPDDHPQVQKYAWGLAKALMGGDEVQARLLMKDDTYEGVGFIRYAKKEMSCNIFAGAKDHHTANDLLAVVNAPMLKTLNQMRSDVSLDPIEGVTLMKEPVSKPVSKKKTTSQPAVSKEKQNLLDKLEAEWNIKMKPSTSKQTLKGEIKRQEMMDEIETAFGTRPAPATTTEALEKMHRQIGQKEEEVRIGGKTESEAIDALYETFSRRTRAELTDEDTLNSLKILIDKTRARYAEARQIKDGTPKTVSGAEMAKNIAEDIAEEEAQAKKPATLEEAIATNQPLGQKKEEMTKADWDNRNLRLARTPWASNTEPAMLATLRDYYFKLTKTPPHQRWSEITLRSKIAQEQELKAKADKIAGKKKTVKQKKAELVQEVTAVDPAFEKFVDATDEHALIHDDTAGVKRRADEALKRGYITKQEHAEVMRIRKDAMAEARKEAKANGEEEVDYDMTDAWDELTGTLQFSLEEARKKPASEAKQEALDFDALTDDTPTEDVTEEDASDDAIDILGLSVREGGVADPVNDRDTFTKVLADAGAIPSMAQGRRLFDFMSPARRANYLAEKLGNRDAVDRATPAHERSVDSAVDGAVIVTDGSSTPIAYDSVNGSATIEMSTISWDAQDKAQLRQQMIDDGVAPDVVDKFIRDVESISAVFHENSQVLAWEPSEMFSAIKGNSDAQYSYSLDFTTICRKTAELITTLSNIQTKIQRGLTPDEVEDVRMAIRKAGSPINCTHCYVFSRWQNMGNILNQMVNRDVFIEEGLKRELGDLTAEELRDQAQQMGLDVTAGMTKPKRVRSIKGDKSSPMIELPSKQKYMKRDLVEAMIIKNTPKQQKEVFGKEWDALFGDIPKDMILDVNRADELARKFPDAWTWRNTRGSGAGKAIETRTEFRSGDIRNAFTTEKAVRIQNLFSGMRTQSWSDFDVLHVIDWMQAVGEASSLGLAMHGYTKVPELVDFLGSTNAMFNLSLIPKESGLDANGNLIFDPVEGMPWDVAIAKRTAHSLTVGTEAIGVSDDHIRALMSHPLIDYIIPFHASGGKLDRIAKALGYKPSDYTKEQEDTIVDRAKWDARVQRLIDKHGMSEAQAKSKIMAHEYWDASLSGDENAKRFLEYAEASGVTPRFSRFKNESGYWKLLIDRKMYDNDGNYIRQKPVQPVFDTKQISELLDKYLAGEIETTTKPADEDIVAEMAGKFGSGVQIDLSVTAIPEKTKTVIEKLVKEINVIRDSWRQRLENIDPKFAGQVNDMEASANELSNGIVKKFADTGLFEKWKEIQKNGIVIDGVRVTPEEARLDLIKNDRKVLAKYVGEETAKDVANLLDRMHEMARNAGIPLGFIEDYLPRMVKDVDGLLKYHEGEFGTKRGFEGFADNWAKVHKGGQPLNTMEEIYVMSLYMSQSKTKGLTKDVDNTKKRMVRDMTDEQAKFYQDPMVTLVLYSQSLGREVAKRRFLGQMFPEYGALIRKGAHLAKQAEALEKLMLKVTDVDALAKLDAKLAQLDVLLDDVRMRTRIESGTALMDGGTPKLLIELYDKGQISAGQIEEAIDLIKNMLSPMRTHAVIRAFENVSYLGNLLQLRATVMNIADSARIIGAFDLKDSLPALFSGWAGNVFKGARSSEFIDVENDLLMDSAELASLEKGGDKMNNFVKKAYDYIGYTLTVKGATSATAEAKIREMKSLVKKVQAGDVKAKEELSRRLDRMFAEVPTLEEIADALNSTEMNGIKRRIAYRGIADLLSVGLSEKTEGERKWYRPAYMFKHYLVKSHEFFWNQGIQNIRQGIKNRNPYQQAKGWKITLSMPASMYGASVMLRALIELVRSGFDWDEWKEKLGDVAFGEWLQLFGVSRYTTHQVLNREDEWDRAFFSFMLPMFSWFWDIGKDIADVKGGKRRLKDIRSARMIPIVGDPFYNIMGYGNSTRRANPEAYRDLQELVSKFDGSMSAKEMGGLSEMRSEIKRLHNVITPLEKLMDDLGIAPSRKQQQLDRLTQKLQRASRKKREALIDNDRYIQKLRKQRDERRRKRGVID